MSRCTLIRAIAGWIFCILRILPSSAQERPEVADGVTHVTLPPGTVTWEQLVGKNTLRISAGQTIVEGQRLFFGDGRVATELVATKQGLQWRSPKDEKGVGFRNSTVEWEPGSIIVLESGYLRPDKLMPGSVYVITSSIKFEVREMPKAKPKPRRPGHSRAGDGKSCLLFMRSSCYSSADRGRACLASSQIVERNRASSR